MTWLDDAPAEDARDLEELSQLARMGAIAAASALAQLLEREVRASAPRARAALSLPSLAGWRTGVVFEAQGDLTGFVAIALSEEAVGAVARAFLGAEPDALPSDAVHSALRELGNILASHTVSSIADALSVRILPSLPLLVIDGQKPSLSDRITGRQAPDAGVRLESELEFDGAVRALLVWVPDPRKRGGPSKG